MWVQFPPVAFHFIPFPLSGLRRMPSGAQPPSGWRICAKTLVCHCKAFGLKGGSFAANSPCMPLVAFGVEGGAIPRTVGNQRANTRKVNRRTSEESLCMPLQSRSGKGGQFPAPLGTYSCRICAETLVCHCKAFGFEGESFSLKSSFSATP